LRFLGRGPYNNKETPMSAADDIELPEQPKDPAHRRAALLVSLLAMILAVASLGGGNAAKDAAHHNLLAANAYAFYQAKNVRQTEYKIAADGLRAQLTHPQLPAPTRTYMEERLADYERTIKRYESEPDTGEGKKELMVRARTHEQERDVAMQRDPWFDYAEALLQISIVLTSVAIIAGTPMLFGGALILGILGSLATLNGFLLLV
jgi:hypothetical protein